MTAVAEQTETVKFESKSPNQVLTRRQPRHTDDGFGGKVVLTESEWFERMEERKRDTGEDFDDTPWRVEFANHIFKTDHPRLIAWLRGHPKFEANASSGFYEAQPTPDELRPTPVEQFQAISRAQANEDLAAGVDQLIALRDNERDTHNRPAIIEAADAALSVMAEEPSESEAVAGSTGDPPSTAKV